MPGTRHLVFFMLTVIFLAWSCAVSVHAQNPLVPHRIKGTIEIDGVSDESAWKAIQSLPLIMRSPDFGGELSEPTEILIGYNDNYLYIAGRLYDSQPSQIQATSLKRDDWKTSLDHVGIIVDTFNDNENAMIFVATPTGVRIDATTQNDALDAPMKNLNLTWNTFWDVKAFVNNEGWFFEMRIPFSSLRFQDTDGGVTMGLTAYRWIPRKYEMVISPPVELKHGFWGFAKPSQTQDVIFEGIHSRNPLYVTPYLIGGLGQNFDLNDLKTDYYRKDNTDFDLGLDVKYGLTNNLTLDVTLNTDFAQVEADDQRVNLTRFSLFYPEKRLFFQERASNFEFNFDESNRLFYSRRIGIYDGEPVSIYGGARIVGRIGSWDVGFLNMQTAPREDIPSENFSVLSLRRQVFNPNTYIGGIVTNRMDFQSEYNSAYGLFGIFNLYGEDYLTLRWAQTFENGKENNPFSLDASRIYALWERRSIEGFAYNLSYSRAGEDYNPGMGYERRHDYSHYRGKLLYGWIMGEKSAVRSHHILTEGFLFTRNGDNSVESAEFGPGWQLYMKSGLNANIAAKMYYEDLTESFTLGDETEVLAGQYTFYGIETSVTTSEGKLYNVTANLEAGSFYDGWRITLGLIPRWNVSPHLELSGFYQINKIGFTKRSQEMLAHVLRLKTLIMINTQLSVSTFIQYNSVSDKIISNIRFRYNPREGNDLYLVYDEGFNTDRYREDPFLPVTNNRTILLKYTYTFDF